MEITIRKATHQDREALSEIHVSSIRELGKSHYSEAEIDAWSGGRTPARYEEHISSCMSGQNTLANVLEP